MTTTELPTTQPIQYDFDAVAHWIIANSYHIDVGQAVVSLMPVANAEYDTAQAQEAAMKATADRLATELFVEDAMHAWHALDDTGKAFLVRFIRSIEDSAEDVVGY